MNMPFNFIMKWIFNSGNSPYLQSTDRDLATTAVGCSIGQGLKVNPHVLAAQHKFWYTILLLLLTQCFVISISFSPGLFTSKYFNSQKYGEFLSFPFFSCLLTTFFDFWFIDSYYFKYFESILLDAHMFFLFPVYNIPHGHF